MSILRAPPGASRMPIFDGAGWLTEDGARRPFLSYVGAEAEAAVNWSDGHQQLHVENSRTHFLDVWMRRAMLLSLGPLPRACVVVDVGCSAGYMLQELRASAPDAMLLGVDLVASELRCAQAGVPDARLLQADACALPLADASVDAVVSANVLEHVPDDQRALAEIHRIMRPGARAVIVIPLDPGSYDYFDRYSGHVRRYARGELARKARAAGLRVLEEMCLGSLLYPLYWGVKQRNRRRYGHLRGQALERKVTRDIEGTRDSRFGRVACSVEEALLRLGVKLPFGIRGLTVLMRPGEDTLVGAAER